MNELRPTQQVVSIHVKHYCNNIKGVKINLECYSKEAKIIIEIETKKIKF